RSRTRNPHPPTRPQKSCRRRRQGSIDEIFGRPSSISRKTPEGRARGLRHAQSREPLRGKADCPPLIFRGPLLCPELAAPSAPTGHRAEPSDPKATSLLAALNQMSAGVGIPQSILNVNRP